MSDADLAPAATHADTDHRAAAAPVTAKAGTGPLRALWNASAGAIGVIAGLAPHVLHHIGLNRPTERNVEAAGLRIAEVRRRGIWREIIAIPGRR